MKTGLRVEIHDVSRYGFDPNEQTTRLTIRDTYASIDDLVRVTDSAARAIVAVKIACVYQTVVQLDGFHEDSALDLVSAGSLLV